MPQESSALLDAAPRRDIEIESFAHRSSGGFLRRLTLPDGRWWFPAVDICKGLALPNLHQALAENVPDSQRTTLGSICALHGMPIPDLPTWTRSSQMLTRSGAESLLDSWAGAEVPVFADWVRAILHPRSAEPAPVEAQDAIEIGDFVYAATGARIRRLTMSDGTHWFPASDVCRHLGYSNTAQTVATHVPTVDVTDLDSLCQVYTVSIPAGREWRSHTLMVNLPGLVALVTGSTKPESAAFKQWAAGVIATLQRDGFCALPGAAARLDAPPEPSFPMAEFTACVERLEQTRFRGEQQQVQLAAHMDAAQARSEAAHVQFLARMDAAEVRAEESHRALMESSRKLTEALVGLAAKPQAAPKAQTAPPPAPAPLPAPRTAPEILAGWQSRFEAPAEVWAVAAYVIPELLLHGELVAVGERNGARLGLAADRVHRCLGFLRRLGCIHQVGITPGVGCPVYVFA